MGLAWGVGLAWAAQQRELPAVSSDYHSRAGSIPSDWNQAGNLPLLSTLRLSRNQLSGLPANWGSGGCEGLRRLTLDNNALRGSLPAGWAFSSLEQLTLHDNQFNGG